MRLTSLFKKDTELDQLLEQEEQLRRREQECMASSRRLAKERADNDNTLPPYDEVTFRTTQRAFETAVSRGDIKNKRLDQTRSLLMLLLLVTATCSLVWWGLQLMQGS